MAIFGIILILFGTTGMLWFGLPAVLTLSSVIASRATGLDVPEAQASAVREHLYRLSGSIVVAAAGASLIYLAR